MLSAAAFMCHIALAVALLSGCGAFRGDSAKLLSPPDPAGGQLHQFEGSAQGRVIQDSSRLRPGQRLSRTRRHHQLVRTQPHLVHNMAAPEIEESSSPSARLNSSWSVRTRLLEDPKVEDEMERMVHLGAPPDAEVYRGPPHTPEADKEFLNGQEAGDESQEASGFNGGDVEEREGGEKGGEGQEPGGRRDRWGTGERGGGGDASEANHTVPDLDSLIGYQRPFYSSGSQLPSLSPPARQKELDGELWETEMEEDLHSSSREAVPVSTRTSSSTSEPAAGAGGTGTYDTDTGTDFGLLESSTKAAARGRELLQPEEDEEDEEDPGQQRHTGRGIRPSDRSEKAEEEKRGRKRAPLTTDPSTTISFTDSSWDQMAKVMPWPPQRSEDSRGGVTEVVQQERTYETQQVMCLAWTDLAERGYVVLNLTHNINCEEFRVDQGVRLLKIMDQVFARRMKSPEGSWILYLSKPTHQQPQLLMNVASDRGVINTNDVLTMLGEIRKDLPEVGIQNFSAAVSCSFPPSQKRSDYSKLFVVLLVIGSVCTVIITSGFVYICWQRRLPATKTTFHADELHSVENGCHDNPTLDVASDSQHEMQKKKPDSNGLSGGGGVGREEASRWQAAAEEQEEEEDTHL